MHLRYAAQRVSVLYSAALAVRLANLAAFEHAAQIRRGLHLSAVRTSFMNALIERRIGSLQARRTKVRPERQPYPQESRLPAKPAFQAPAWLVFR